MSGKMKRTLGDLMAEEAEGFVDRGGEDWMAARLSQRRADDQTDKSQTNRCGNSPSEYIY